MLKVGDGVYEFVPGKNISAFGVVQSVTPTTALIQFSDGRTPALERSIPHAEECKREAEQYEVRL